MCGRAAQTVQVAQAAANALGAHTGIIRVRRPRRGNESGNNGLTNRSMAGASTSTTPASNIQEIAMANIGLEEGSRDNYNMSPGMDASVIWMEDGEFKVDQKV